MVYRESVVRRSEAEERGGILIFTASVSGNDEKRTGISHKVVKYPTKAVKMA